MNKSLLCLSSLLLFALASCGGTSTSKPVQTSEVEEDPLKVQVLVLSGQSNMQGSTFWDNGQKWLEKVCEERNIDYDPFVEGIPEIQTSFRGYYPYGGGDPAANCYASNMEDRMAGKFLDTKVGMGMSSNVIGPEIGLSYTLRDYASVDKPIFFIKSAFSGSSFQNTGKNWKVADDQDGKEGALWTETKEYVHNNLKLIEDMGFHPEIEAWLWHQGESDCEKAEDAENYYGYMTHLLEEFRAEFGEYGREQDGENIAFVDCTIYDGTRLTYAAVDALNETKKSISEQSENNYLINASTKDEDGLALEIGGYQNLDGCDNIYHYTTADIFRLGEAYGQILLDNDIIA